MCHGNEIKFSESLNLRAKAVPLERSTRQNNSNIIWLVIAETGFRMADKFKKLESSASLERLLLQSKKTIQIKYFSPAVVITHKLINCDHMIGQWMD